MKEVNVNQLELLIENPEGGIVVKNNIEEFVKNHKEFVDKIDVKTITVGDEQLKSYKEHSKELSLSEKAIEKGIEKLMPKELLKLKDTLLDSIKYSRTNRLELDKAVTIAKNNFVGDNKEKAYELLQQNRYSLKRSDFMSICDDVIRGKSSYNKIKEAIFEVAKNQNEISDLRVQRFEVIKDIIQNQYNKRAEHIADYSLEQKSDLYLSKGYDDEAIIAFSDVEINDIKTKRADKEKELELLREEEKEIIDCQQEEHKLAEKDLEEEFKGEVLEKHPAFKNLGEKLKNLGLSTPKMEIPKKTYQVWYQACYMIEAESEEEAERIAEDMKISEANSKKVKVM